MYHHYDNIEIRDFFNALIDSPIAKKRKRTYNSPSSLATPADKDLTITPSSPTCTPGKKVTVKYVFEYLNSCLTDDMIVLADVGDALFAGADLIISESNVSLYYHPPLIQVCR